MGDKCKNLWILTEERPKKSVLKMIFSYFAQDQKCGFFGDTIRIIPLLDSEKCFDFTYQVVGFTCAKVNKIFIKTVSGSSSFVDFLIYYQDDQPEQKTNLCMQLKRRKLMTRRAETQVCISGAVNSFSSITFIRAVRR